VTAVEILTASSFGRRRRWWN